MSLLEPYTAVAKKDVPSIQRKFIAFMLFALFTAAHAGEQLVQHFIEVAREWNHDPALVAITSKKLKTYLVHKAPNLSERIVAFYGATLNENFGVVRNIEGPISLTEQLDQNGLTPLQQVLKNHYMWGNAEQLPVTREHLITLLALGASPLSPGRRENALQMAQRLNQTEFAALFINHLNGGRQNSRTGVSR